MKSAKNPQKQLSFLKKGEKSYGGELRKKGKNRGARPLATKTSMHLVLRSSKARGSWSFSNPKNKAKVRFFVEKQSRKYGVHVLSFANVGNHLHLQIQLTSRALYRPFIRGLTAGIAILVAGTTKNRPLDSLAGTPENGVRARFWDYRPFTRILTSFREFLSVKDYIYINQLEGLGVGRVRARSLLIPSKERGSSA